MVMARQDGRRTVTRRGALLGAVAAGLTAAPALSRPSAAMEGADGNALFAALDQKITEGMERYAVPGAAAGVIWNGRSYLRGYGVTDVSNPQPVDADTLFRIASVTKTFNGTAAMRLVDQGRLALDGRVDSYVGDFVAPAGAQGVTVRQLLDHTAGWLGDDFHDTGSDDGALARYVRDIRNLPQLTPVGEVFSYSNSALGCAGRVIETVTGLTYETAVEQLVFEPLGMSRSAYAATPDGLDNLAMPHSVGEDGRAVVNPGYFDVPRDNNPFGGQSLSSVRDLLSFARFHLGDGRAADGRRVMSLAALRGMWSTPGPGGTVGTELIGMGVSWQVRPTAEGVVVVQHGGNTEGYNTFLMLVPAQRLALVLLTNGDGGGRLTTDLFTKGWALRHFAGLGNLPAPPRSLSASELAQYEDQYTAEVIDYNKPAQSFDLQLTGLPDGTLRLMPAGSDTKTVLAFYTDDYVINETNGVRSDFLRDGSGAVAWLRYGGWLYRRGGSQPQEPVAAPSDDELLPDYAA